MVSKKWNQFVKSRMGEDKRDLEKLITLNNHIIRKGHHSIREPILLFHPLTGRLVKWADSITEEEYHTHIVHTPDIIFWIGSELHILEIDGWIHNESQKVAHRDKFRLEHYQKASLTHHIINEEEVAVLNDTYQRRTGATIQQLLSEVDKIIQ